MINHIVLLSFKSALSEAEINTILEALRNLANIIPEIKSFKAGINCSPEGLHRGFLHGFIMQFENGISRDIYLNHPEHKKVASELVIPALQDGLNSVVVFDFLVNEINSRF